MKRVLIVTGKLQKYRIPVFNKIVEKGVDLTVAHSSDKLNDGTFKFKEVILREKKIGPFTYHVNDFIKFCNQYDIVVPTFYLQKLSFMRLLFGMHKYKLAYWGIGVKASQTSAFNSPTLINILRYQIARKSDAMIFYTDFVRDKYIEKNVSPAKLFVMHNTIDIDQRFVNDNVEQRKNILFIGTLNKSKKIFELLYAYKQVDSMKNVIPPLLEIVGSGADYEKVKEWVKKNEMSSRIILHGSIYDIEEKSKIFNRALCAISPGQAGLSVLEAMGYGLPFVTHKSALTGGERLNIYPKYNGLLFDKFDELSNIILDISVDKEKYIEMGQNARKYYLENRTLDHMVNGFIQTINFLKK